ncbi:MAG: nicotinate (nicotinamide) nucleotide adenylyltransferase, partial [Nitrospinaceae bacterium]|nr:nicotinate (nicotinamide) nucleotide adenylyltransferase [Nitrospinaceae bacterium]
IGLLGGTFDPVHTGHLHLAGQAQKFFNLEKVVFIPAYRSPHKLALEPVSCEHRLAMLTLALDGLPRFSMDKIEINKNEVSYTIETLKELQSNHPDWNMFLILGADAFQAIDTWKQCSQLLDYCNLLVGTRPGAELQVSDTVKNKLALSASATDVKVFKNLKKGTGVTFFQISPLDISSKEIRQRIHRGEEVKNLLPPSVDHYIMQHRLY